MRWDWTRYRLHNTDVIRHECVQYPLCGNNQHDYKWSKYKTALGNYIMLKRCTICGRIQQTRKGRYYHA